MAVSGTRERTVAEATMTYDTVRAPELPDVLGRLKAARDGGE